MQYYEAGETVLVTVKRNGDNGYEEKVIEVTLGRKADLTDSGKSTQEDSDFEDNEESEESGGNDGYPDEGDQYNQDLYGENWYDFGGRSQIPYSDEYGGLGDLFRYFGF